ncbi:acyltransferase domain-containing protein [Saccharopolyspora erythraea]|uniref:Malonyl-CoA:ACP transacylase (MAT) domain-containing protein n=2 Tax=Saccharopolyspora erythraea TaxID=1836 RepID=A0ABN1DKT2_SACER|nr:acyltransferase domain-containing protein [Saccharopolyspora erythraea]EQD84855.1 crotonase [Saccharopolyspora erythraea D]QRK92383.1 acyltransferase domain-containing protein [Saccharopolyspora erythraea]CAM02054.1 similar to Enoyl-CoA hydratase/isomerase [Saccharopolyspora erythraea NRRL 2338]
MEAILGGADFDADEAERYGWINRTLPDAELDEFVARLARRIASFPAVDAAYWWHNVRDSVRFRGAVDRLVDDGYRVFVEIGPHPVLAHSLRECLESRGT